MFAFETTRSRCPSRSRSATDTAAGELSVGKSRDGAVSRGDASVEGDWNRASQSPANGGTAFSAVVARARRAWGYECRSSITSGLYTLPGRRQRLAASGIHLNVSDPAANRTVLSRAREVPLVLLGYHCSNEHGRGAAPRFVNGRDIRALACPTAARAQDPGDHSRTASQAG